MTPTPRDVARSHSHASGFSTDAWAQTTGTAQLPPCADAVPVPTPAGDRAAPSVVGSRAGDQVALVSVSAPSPAGSPERVFARGYGADRSQDDPAQRRARLRDDLYKETERLQRALGLTRGRDRDLDLALEYVNRAVDDLLHAVHAYDRALAATTVPAPHHRARTP